MVTGIGIDLIEIERIEDSITRHGDRFLNKVFTPSEIDYCSAKPNSAQHFAARFCAKEAVYKAFHQSFQKKLSWKDISVSNSFSQKPKIEITLNEWEQIKEHYSIEISLTHSDNYAACVALIQKIR